MENNYTTSSLNKCISCILLQIPNPSAWTPIVPLPTNCLSRHQVASLGHSPTVGALPPVPRVANDRFSVLCGLAGEGPPGDCERSGPLGAIPRMKRIGRRPPGSGPATTDCIERHPGRISPANTGMGIRFIHCTS